ncbi:MAG TPA: glycoside hydrolase family 3 N-terminal domain-containing protein [Candidatus Polarisedimenticolia bacterium]
MSRSARQREEQAGQLLWIGFEGTGYHAPLERLIRKIRPGGIILFSRNIDTERQLRGLTDALHRAVTVPPFIALDQEGGRVNRLKPFLGPTPSSQWLAHQTRPAEAVRTHATAMVLALKTLGFNLNFAPVLDLSGPNPRNGIGDRAFDDDPRRVAELGAVSIRTHLRGGILPVGKHFPGLGFSRADTHLTLPVIRRSRNLLLRNDLLPYRRLKSILPIVMVGHAYYPAVQGRPPAPATLSSRVVGGLLRKQIGYRGLILTDDLEMGALDQTADPARQALEAFTAGSDGLMFCRSEEKILTAWEGLIRSLESGAIPAARWRQSQRRILALKRRALLSRRRSRYSRGTLARARLLIESLEGPSAGGFDPTARA